MLHLPFLPIEVQSSRGGQETGGYEPRQSADTRTSSEHATTEPPRLALNKHNRHNIPTQLSEALL